MSMIVASLRNSVAQWLAALIATDLRGDAHQVALHRLLFLRRTAFVVQSVLAIVVWMTGIVELSFGWVAALLLVIPVSNLLIRYLNQEASPRVVALTILLDVVILTGLLYFSGGPANPFSVFYLIQVMLAALLTTQGWSWAVVTASSLGYAGLFWKSVALPAQLGGGHHHHASGSFSFHLQGMWLAFTISAILIAWFVSNLAQALRSAHEQQDNSRRLLSLAALAAGAAHEIGNPLGTIYIAAGELERALKRQKAPESALLEDAQLITEEVGRAKKVLDRMAAAAGEMQGEGMVSTTLDAIFSAAMQEIDPIGERVTITLPTSDANNDSKTRLMWPVQAVSQALSQLLRNAIQASPLDRKVELFGDFGHHGVRIRVRDYGAGMSKELMERVGEPFYTTRPGQGMGLGVFIARSLIEQLGGTLDYHSSAAKAGAKAISKDQGTTAELWLPYAVR